MIPTPPSSHNLGYSIGQYNFKTGLSLAPMAGNTNLAYRVLCRKHGAELTTTEMVSSMALKHNDKKSLGYLVRAVGETPVAAQIFGAEPETLANAVQHVQQQGFDIVDLNIGCPVPKITGCGGGSALLRDPKLAKECVSAMKEAATIPVTVKIRAGWDDEQKNAPEFAIIMEEAGAEAVTVHGRTREQKYSGHADLELIKRVVQSVTIPVIGNGDVTDFESAKKMAETGVQGIAIGRGALGKPWFFNQLQHFFEGTPIPKDPPIEVRSQLLEELGLGVCELYGENRGMRIMRRLSADFFHGLKGAPQMRAKCSQLSSLEDLKDLCSQFVELTV
jgi:tRNA-dihydrouridine synthase B